MGEPKVGVVSGHCRGCGMAEDWIRGLEEDNARLESGYRRRGNELDAEYARIKALESALRSVRRQTMCEGAGRTLQRIARIVDKAVPPPEPSEPEARALDGEAADPDGGQKGLYALPGMGKP